MYGFGGLGYCWLGCIGVGVFILCRVRYRVGVFWSWVFEGVLDIIFIELRKEVIKNKE